MQNYEMLVDKISRAAGLAKEEVERRIEAKKAKLSGLISKEGAAQIVAAELGVNFENEMFKVSELIPGMKKVNLVGKIVSLFPVREYNKNGRQGKIGSFIIADETGSLRVVLWDSNHIGLIEKSEINLDDVLEIRNGTMREHEMHLTSFSEIKKSSVAIENVKRERNFADKNISAIQENQPVKLRATIVQFFPPRFFHVCKECGKKATPNAEGLFECLVHGKVQANERPLLSLVIDDGTESLRVVLFGEQIAKIFTGDLKNPEELQKFRDDLLGQEIFVSGMAKKNQLFNNLELNVSDISKVDVEKLVEELEKVKSL